MIKFNSPVIHENIWKIYLKTNKEVSDFYYEDKKNVEKEKIYSVIEYRTSTIYIDKELDDNSTLKALRKKLVNLYLWETGQQDHSFNEEEFCDLASVSIPLIYKIAENLLLKIKEEKKEEM